MAAPWTWDVGKPDGTEDPGTIDDIIRAQIKAVLLEFFQGFSNFPTSALLKEGTARITADVAASLPGAANEGEMYYATDTGRLYVWASGAWVDIPFGARHVVLPLVSGLSHIVAGTAGVWKDVPVVLMEAGRITYWFSTWTVGHGVWFDPAHYPSGAQGWLRGVTYPLSQPIDLRLWNVTGGVAVAGSEVIGANTGTVCSLRSGAPFALPAGAVALRPQVRQNTNLFTSAVLQAELEIGW